MKEFIQDTNAFIGGIFGMIIALIAGALFVTYIISMIWPIIALGGFILVFIGVLSYIKIKGNPIKIDKKVVPFIIGIGLIAMVFGFVNVIDFGSITHPFSILQGILPSMNLYGGV
jgi:hypothetical protein